MIDLDNGEKTEWCKLQAAFEKAKSELIAWLDAKALEKATVKPGEMLYSLDDHRPVGIVKNVYRYPEDSLRLSVNYHFSPSAGYIDNTSRQPERRFGSKQELIAALELDGQRLAARRERLENGP